MRLRKFLWRTYEKGRKVSVVEKDFSAGKEGFRIFGHIISKKPHENENMI